MKSKMTYCQSSSPFITQLKRNALGLPPLNEIGDTIVMQEAFTHLRCMH